MFGMKSFSIVCLAVTFLDSSYTLASEVQQWSVQIVDEVAVLRTSKHTDAKYVKGTIAALKMSGVKKFALRTQKTDDKAEETKSAYSIRILDDVAEISASYDLPYKYLVATITQLKDAGVKKIKFSKTEKPTDETSPTR